MLNVSPQRASAAWWHNELFVSMQCDTTSSSVIARFLISIKFLDFFCLLNHSYRPLPRHNCSLPFEHSMGITLHKLAYAQGATTAMASACVDYERMPTSVNLKQPFVQFRRLCSDDFHQWFCVLQHPPWKRNGKTKANGGKRGDNFKIFLLDHGLYRELDEVWIIPSVMHISICWRVRYCDDTTIRRCQWSLRYVRFEWVGKSVFHHGNRHNGWQQTFVREWRLRTSIIERRTEEERVQEVWLDKPGWTNSERLAFGQQTYSPSHFDRFGLFSQTPTNQPTSTTRSNAFSLPSRQHQQPVMPSV